MKRIIAIIAFAVTSALAANAQTYIKSNGLYWLGLLPNVQIEGKITNNITLQGEINASLWFKLNNAPMVGAQFIVNPRWYFKDSFDGWYVGPDIAMDVFKMSKWNYWDTNSSLSHREQRGYGFYVGAMGGYQMQVASRLKIDFYAGFGWHLGVYRGYLVNKVTDTEVMYADWNKSGEWIPYRVGVAIAYRLQRF